MEKVVACFLIKTSKIYIIFYYNNLIHIIYKSNNIKLIYYLIITIDYMSFFNIYQNTIYI